MPSPVAPAAPVAIKSAPANPAPSANHAAAPANDATNSGATTEEATKDSAAFAQMLLLQLGLGEQTPAVATTPPAAVVASIVADDNPQDSADTSATDPAAAFSAMLAAMGIAQQKAPQPITTTTATTATITTATASDAAATAAIGSSKGKAAATDLAAPPAVAADDGKTAGILGAADDKAAAKVAAFDQLLTQADTKTAAVATAGADAPPVMATNNIHTASHTPPANVEATAHVATPVRDPNWGKDFSQKVVWVAGQDKQSAQLTLNPPQLGPVEVTINVSRDQTTAVFSSPHIEVRQAIESALPQLREAMAAAGIQLGQASVNSESFRQQQEQQQAQAQSGQSRRHGDDGILAGDSGSDTIIRSTPIKQGLGLVDTFA